MPLYKVTFEIPNLFSTETKIKILLLESENIEDAFLEIDNELKETFLYHTSRPQIIDIERKECPHCSYNKENVMNEKEIETNMFSEADVKDLLSDIGTKELIPDIKDKKIIEINELYIAINKDNSVSVFFDKPSWFEETGQWSHSPFAEELFDYIDIREKNKQYEICKINYEEERDDKNTCVIPIELKDDDILLLYKYKEGKKKFFDCLSFKPGMLYKIDSERILLVGSE